MEHFRDKINSILDNLSQSDDTRYQLRVVASDIDKLIDDYRKAILVTQTAYNNSTTQKDLHQNALNGYKKHLNDLLAIKEDLAAALAAIS